MFRTYKRKLILTKAQENTLRRWIGACRVVYNLGLEIRIESYKKLGKSVHKYALGNQLTLLRKELSWMNDVSRCVLHNSIERLDKSFQSFFRGGGFPKFASSKKYKSIDFNQGLKYTGDKIRLAKIGWLKIVKDSPVIGEIINVTVKIEPTGFFACIQCRNVPPKFQSENQAIGIDMGIAKLATLSDGSSIDNPRHFAKYERTLRIEHRSLSRKKKGSNSWKKQAKRLGVLHHKVANVRRDFLHKESTKIAKAYTAVYLENLNISGMVKSSLGKSISDAGWGEFRSMLEYKTNVVAISPAYTSQTCNECGHIAKNNRISQAEFKCIACGHEANADHNAALNIKSKGIALDRERKAVA